MKLFIPGLLCTIVAISIICFGCLGSWTYTTTYKGTSYVSNQGISIVTKEIIFNHIGTLTVQPTEINGINLSREGYVLSSYNFKINQYDILDYESCGFIKVDSDFTPRWLQIILSVVGGGAFGLVIFVLAAQFLDNEENSR